MYARSLGPCIDEGRSFYPYDSWVEEELGGRRRDNERDGYSLRGCAELRNVMVVDKRRVKMDGQGKGRDDWSIGHPNWGYRD